MKHFKTDIEAYKDCEFRHKWLFNKLQIAEYFGYNCGARGTEIPQNEKLIVRPIVNLLGMGEGAFIARNLQDIPSGYFWCEFFEGDHLSVDFTMKNNQIEQTLVVRGRKSSTTTWRWTEWTKVGNVRLELTPKVENLLTDLLSSYKFCNIEFIDGKPIEIHLRPNPDFYGKPYKYLIPVWSDQPITGNKKGWKFIEDREEVNGELRLGFWTKNK